MASAPSLAAGPLIVTDDAALARDLARRLEGLGYVPQGVADQADRALAMAARLPVDLVLLDIGLAGRGNGQDTAGLFRERLGLPVIFLTEQVDRATLEVVAQADGHGCLVKSALDRELLATMEMALHRCRQERRLDEQARSQARDGLRQALEQAVTALTVTSETRDPFTAGHQQRVSRLAEAIARELGLAEEVREGVRMAGLVHDIGKIHVPSEILAKPEALSSLEWGIVQGHSEVGRDILKDVPFPWPVARMVLEHHERLDGSGYPAGLVGEAILIESRILAVADVVEAMTAHRPYRTALGLDQAMVELRLGRGARYDPGVVDACLALCENDSILELLRLARERIAP